ncbi:MAG: helix-turn-helix transcriptional regulator [Eubacterium sp.]|nr:helix-turn-helix transcriptional regulator [Eubacterium sp.]
MLKGASELYKNVDDETRKDIKIEEFLADLAVIFVKYRINNNLSQKELADKLGMSQVMISKLESGEYNPSIKKLCEMFMTLGLGVKLSVFKPGENNYIGSCDLMQG